MFFDLKVQSDKSVTDDAKIEIFSKTSKLLGIFFVFMTQNAYLCSVTPRCPCRKTYFGVSVFIGVLLYFATGAIKLLYLFSLLLSFGN